MLAGGVQKQQFQNRLKRVAAGGENTTSQIYAGTKEPVRKRKKYEVRTDTQDAVLQDGGSGASMPVSLISGILIGAAAVVLARFLWFKLTGGAFSGVNADLVMLIDIVLAITIAIILRVIFRFNSKIHGFGKLAGVLAMVVLMHNAVHLAPGIFERAFSAQWVQNVVILTKPNSVLIAGVSYELAPQSTLVSPKHPGEY